MQCVGGVHLDGSGEQLFEASRVHVAAVHHQAVTTSIGDERRVLPQDSAQPGHLRPERTIGIIGQTADPEFLAKTVGGHRAVRFNQQHCEQQTLKTTPDENRIADATNAQRTQYSVRRRTRTFLIHIVSIAPELLTVERPRPRVTRD